MDEYGVLAKYYEFIRTCHNINIIVQTTYENLSRIPELRMMSSIVTIINITVTY